MRLVFISTSDICIWDLRSQDVEWNTPCCLEIVSKALKLRETGNIPRVLELPYRRDAAASQARVFAFPVRHLIPQI